MNFNSFRSIDSPHAEQLGHQTFCYVDLHAKNSHKKRRAHPSTRVTSHSDRIFVSRVSLYRLGLRPKTPRTFKPP